jgi:TatA/E family protein of Tat protein translocase
VGNIGPTELLIFLAILLLIFGAAKLPKLARSMGQAGKEFKAGMKEGYQAEEVEGPCPFCGVEVAADAKFCPGCGKPSAEIVAEKEKKKSA